MLGAAHVAHSVPFWPNFGWILAGLVPLLPFAYKGFRSWRYERRLLRGIPASPGIDAVSPLGTRLRNQELGLAEVREGIKHHTAVLDHHTGQLQEQSGQLDKIAHEVTANGGSSIKDQMGRADRNAARAVDLSEQALRAITELTTRFDNLRINVSADLPEEDENG